MSTVSLVSNTNYNENYTPQYQSKAINSTDTGTDKANEGMKNDSTVYDTAQTVASNSQNSTADQTVTNSDDNDSNTEKITEENKKIRDTIATLNKKIASNTEAVFGVHDETNRITIKIVDKDTKKVIKELPPEKTLDMIAKVWELAGLIVDEKR